MMIPYQLKEVHKGLLHENVKDTGLKLSKTKGEEGDVDGVIGCLGEFVLQWSLIGFGNNWYQQGCDQDGPGDIPENIVRQKIVKEV